MPRRPEHPPHASARRFPNTGTLAYFLPNSQTIHFNEIRDGDVEVMRSSHDHRGLVGTLGIAYHEFTHWADLVGTVWGRGHLHGIYDCLRLVEHVETSGREWDFHKFVDLHDEERRLMLPEYYTTIDEDAALHDYLRRWGIQFSAGREFDSMGRIDDGRPILFVKFLDRSTGRQIVRQPLTVGALLETNAMWSELRTRRDALNEIAAPTRAVEEAHWNSHLLAELYDEELTLYTAPVHLLAHHAKLTDTDTAFRASATVANLALNLCPRHFDALEPPTDFEPWNNLVPSFKRRRNHAFAYATICANGGPLSHTDGLAEWVEAALAASSLPPSNVLLAEARKEITAQIPTTAATPADEVEKYLLEVGLQVFDHRASDNALTPRRAATERLALPRSFDMDGALFGLSATTLDEKSFDPVAAWDRQEALRAWTDNFLGSCR